ncbi:MAG: 3-deoxy-manno-octulosonate cytidylyltransferase [Verrucomicrobia bacterium]|nr:3-deoxy-manno-octulosonate cytidylyltransferase [Verrucomicrobiota bacterium]
MNEPRVVAVIPARYASTRFPGKPLTLISGKPLLQWVWEGCIQSRTILKVWIATDDKRIAQVARSFGAMVTMTRGDHLSGTDRVAEASKDWFPDWVINIQGDEPLIHGSLLDRFIAGLNPSFGMATMATPLTDPADLQKPDVVKVSFNRTGKALGFRRLVELAEAKDWSHQHVGIYAYQPKTLQKIVRLPPSTGEIRERLEQLRALENRIAIQVLPFTFNSVGVDTPGDVPRAERALADRATRIST